jgi:hypothetical protein
MRYTKQIAQVTGEDYHLGNVISPTLVGLVNEFQ